MPFYYSFCLCSLSLSLLSVIEHEECEESEERDTSPELRELSDSRCKTGSGRQA
ncbi:hypothetical protein HMPREF3214_00905 [Alloscardovia omnicolens]|nr:hypothetical protein HMPREF3214_00905 [Alloscardovia omnicolens]